MVYFALVHTQLLYGIKICGNATRSNLNKLLILNTVIKFSVLFKTNRNNALCRMSIKFLTPCQFQNYINFNYCAWYIKYVHRYNQLPVNTFANYFSLNKKVQLYHTRSSSHLRLSCVNTSYGTIDVSNLKQVSCGTPFLENTNQIHPRTIWTDIWKDTSQWCCYKSL